MSQSRFLWIHRAAAAQHHYKNLLRMLINMTFSRGPRFSRFNQSPSSLFCLHSIWEGDALSIRLTFGATQRCGIGERGERQESSWCLNSPLRNLLVTKLEPQSTLRTVTQHGDDTNTNHWTPLCFSTGYFSLFFLFFFFSHTSHHVSQNDGVH